MGDSRYKMVRYDGGFPPHPQREAAGVFHLSGHKWHLVFRGSKPGVTGGLLRVEITAEPLGPRSCRVTVRGRGDGSLRGTFDLPTTAAGVLEENLRRRYDALAADAAVETRIEHGSWWLGPDPFAAFGWAATASVTGVRYLGGVSAQPLRSGWRHRQWSKVLDFGPDGVTLRAFRRRFTLPWEDIVALEIAAAGSAVEALGASAAPGIAVPHGSSVVVIGLRSGERAVFGATQPADEVGEKLAGIAAAVAARPAASGGA